ncbi:MAG: 6,7-dimethyl-8-ribityllumazine synthase [Leptolyngbya sp. PLA3]|nr:MAG: 6,7-dimethyl-8-ribityllumazine synthase [Cyanobacteria bacterium CYA]MCE7970007.1 6,7-dimethyl-8-ribityllumazine synthase [Leptolyngbya sp. PL-A3]
MSRATTQLPPVAIVVSRYNATITNALLEGARSTYLGGGGSADRLGVIEAPGAFELPVLANALAQSGMYRGVVALGCVIKGETRHDEFIAGAIAHAIADISIRTGVPVAFGVLTTDNAEQARARAGGDKGNKGAEAMVALLETLDALKDIGDAADTRTPGIACRLKSPVSDKSRGSA